MTSTVEFRDHLPRGPVRATWPYLPSTIALTVAVLLLAQAGSVRGVEAVYGLVVACLLLAVGLWDAATCLRAERAARVTDPSAPAASTQGPGSTEVREQSQQTSSPAYIPGRALLVAVVLVASAVLMPLVGYYLIVPLLLVPTMVIAGIRDVRRLVLVGLGAWLSAYAIFELALGVSLPGGGF